MLSANRLPAYRNIFFIAVSRKSQAVSSNSLVSIAWRNLFHDKARFAISISGVAFSVFLVLILLGLFRGWNEKIVEYITNTNSDIWILQRGGDDFFNSISVLPLALKEEIEKVENVRQVHSLIGRQISFEHGGDTVRVYIIGYDPADPLGGPLKVVKGENVPGEGEIIIDKVFAKTKKVELGDTLRIIGSDFTVSGIAEGGDLVFVQFAFMNRSEAEKLFAFDGLTSFYLVMLEDKTNAVATVQRIEEELPGVTAITQEDYKESNRQEINDIFIPILTVLVFIGFLVGLTVVGLMTYTSTIEKSKEYGILKAIGASNKFLYEIIVKQSIFTGLAGFVVGISITVLARLLLEGYVPQFVTKIIGRDIALTLLLILLMSISAAFVPIRRIAQIEPATVFK